LSFEKIIDNRKKFQKFGFFDSSKTETVFCQNCTDIKEERKVLEKCVFLEKNQKFLILQRQLYKHALNS